MKIALLLVGKTTDSRIASLTEEYIARVAHYAPIEVEVVPELRNKKSLSPEQQKIREGELLLARLRPSDYVVILDERGEQLSSVAFAHHIETWQTSLGAKRTVFVVGGPFGFSSVMYKRAQANISLSEMTFSHQMVRLFFAEQLYRAFTIIKGEPYHHN